MGTLLEVWHRMSRRGRDGKVAPQLLSSWASCSYSSIAMDFSSGSSVMVSCR